MSVISHLESLNMKHDKLKDKIQEAYIYHLPVTELKKEKLKVKDEIYKLMNSFDQQEAA